MGEYVSSLTKPFDRRLIAFPRLGFHYEECRYARTLSKETLQPVITVIDVNPHSYREAERGVETGLAVFS